MLNTLSLVEKVSLTKDLVADQTYLDLSEKINTAGLAFDAVEGLGASTSTSSMVLIHMGGFPDQYIQASMKYIAPTAAGSEDIGVMLRAVTVESSAPGGNYYYARVDGGFAKITKVLNGTFSTLTQSAFALPQDTLVTITFQAVGDALSATFDAGGSPATVNLNTTDSDIARRGIFGFRSLTSSVYCRSFTVEEL